MPIGNRIPVNFAEAFPKGTLVVGAVEAVIDFDASTPQNRVQARDKDTGDPVWAIDVVDPDPEARTKFLKVKIAARTEPVLPDAQPGAPFRPVEFDGLSVTPYIVLGERPRIAYSYRASGLRAPKAAPRPLAAGSGA